MKAYTIKYRNFSADSEKTITVLADNKEDAWDKASFEAIPAREGKPPYSAWVKGVTYQNGNYKRFKTHEGKPY